MSENSSQSESDKRFLKAQQEAQKKLKEFAEKYKNGEVAFQHNHR